MFGEPLLQDYEFKETSYEQIDARSVPSGIFETAHNQIAITDLDNNLIASNIGVPSTELSMGDLVNLKINILYNLDQVDRNIKDFTDVNIISNSIHVDSVVPTNSRRSELISALADVSFNPNVKINIRTEMEVLQTLKRLPVKLFNDEQNYLDSYENPAQKSLSEYLEHVLKVRKSYRPALLLCGYKLPTLSE